MHNTSALPATTGQPPISLKDDARMIAKIDDDTRCTRHVRTYEVRLQYQSSDQLSEFGRGNRDRRQECNLIPTLGV